MVRGNGSGTNLKKRVENTARPCGLRFCILIILQKPYSQQKLLNNEKNKQKGHQPGSI